MSKITKNSLANFSKAFPQAPSLYSRLNVSKLGFISASKNYSQMQGENGYTTTDPDDELGALTQKSKENVEDLMETIQDTGHETKERSKDESQETAKDKAEETAEKLKESVAVEDDVPEKKVYEDVVESARKVGNLDHEKKKQQQQQ